MEYVPLCSSILSITNIVIDGLKATICYLETSDQKRRQSRKNTWEERGMDFRNFKLKRVNNIYLELKKEHKLEDKLYI